MRDPVRILVTKRGGKQQSAEQIGIAPHRVAGLQESNGFRHVLLTFSIPPHKSSRVNHQIACFQVEPYKF